jgi:hypothetical protein
VLVKRWGLDAAESLSTTLRVCYDDCFRAISKLGTVTAVIGAFSHKYTVLELRRG